LTHFKFFPRKDADLQPTAIKLTFDDGASEKEQVFSISASGRASDHQFLTPVVTTSVKAEIASMMHKGLPSGGAFEFVGVPCNIAEAASKRSPAMNLLKKAFSNTFAPLPGMKIDVHKNGKWNEGTVKSIVTADGSKYAFVSVAESAVQYVTAMSEIKPCGSEVTTRRDCGTEQVEDFGYTFTFKGGRAGAKGSKDSLDVDGSVFTDRDAALAFGWQADASSNAVKCPGEDSKGIEFPPSAFNSLCEKDKAKCEPNAWILEVPSAGSYYVMLTAGHPCQPSEGTRQYDIQVNNIPFFAHENLSKGQSYTVAKVIEVGDDKTIRVSAYCHGDNDDESKKACSTSHSTISMVQVRKQKAGDPESD